MSVYSFWSSFIILLVLISYVNTGFCDHTASRNNTKNTDSSELTHIENLNQPTYFSTPFDMHYGELTNATSVPASRSEFDTSQGNWDKVQPPHRLTFPHHPKNIEHGVGTLWLFNEFTVDPSIDAHELGCWIHINAAYTIYVNGHFIKQYGSTVPHYWPYDYETPGFIIPKKLLNKQGPNLLAIKISIKLIDSNVLDCCFISPNQFNERYFWRFEIIFLLDFWTEFPPNEFHKFIPAIFPPN